MVKPPSTERLEHPPTNPHENSLAGAMMVLIHLKHLKQYNQPTEAALLSASSYTGRYYQPDDLDLAIADMNSLRVVPKDRPVP
jgi:hypothetical protein